MCHKKLVKFFDNEAKAPYGACSVAYVIGDRLETYSGNGCHGVLHSAPVKKMSAVYTSLWSDQPGQYRGEDYDKIAVQYWDYLFNPEISPYRQALSKFEILKNEEGKYIAFGILDMEVPLQIAAALFFQTRVPYHTQWKAINFDRWLKSGFSPTEAYYLSEVIIIENDALFKALWSNGAHSVNLDINLLASGEPRVNKDNSWAKGSSSYVPVASPWASQQFTVPPVYGLLKNTVKYTGVFPAIFKKMGSTAVKDSQLLFFDDAVKVLKRERSKWSYLKE